MMGVGVNAGVVYTGDDIRQGKGATPGTIGNNGQGKNYIFCRVAAAQEIVNGTVVTWDGSFVCTIASATAPASAAGRQVAVAVCSVTASASTYIWCQTVGPCIVRASANAAANVVLTMGQTAGVVDDGATSASAVITGMYLTATVTAAGTQGVAYLNNPALGFA